MDRTVSDYSNHSARSTVYIPRLKIRNASQETHSTAPNSMVSLPLDFTGPSQDQYANSSSSRYASSQAPSYVNSRRSSVVSHPTQASSTSNQPPKKKKGFLTSLFSTKEPSLKALEDYEKQLKIAGNVKDGQTAAITLSGVSTAKMPAYVPKTNSKWDGNPATATNLNTKDRFSNRLQPPSMESFDHRSVPSSSSDSMRPTDRRPASRRTLSTASFYTAHSNSSRNQLAELYGWEVADFSSGVSCSSTTTGTRAASLRSTSDQTGAIAEQNPLEPPRIPGEFAFPAPINIPGSPQLPAHSYSPALTPRDDLPLTPTGPSPAKDVRSVDSEKTLNEQEMDQSEICETCIEAPNQAGEIRLTSNDVNVLGPPIATRRRANTTKSRNEQQDGTSKVPRSILKKESAYGLDHRTYHDSTMESLSSQTAVLDYYHGPQWKKKMGVHTARRARRMTAKTASPDDRNASPTPEMGITTHRKSIVGMFKPS